MLDPWIIEEIRRREEEEAREREHPRVEIPMDMPVHPERGGSPTPGQKEERGVTIVDFGV
jgi:hypothetical protein